MSWACSFTGISGYFNDRQRIGIKTDCTNPASTVDFVNAAVQSDLRTLIVEPGSEEAVKVAVAKACERKVRGGGGGFVAEHLSQITKFQVHSS